MIKTKENSGSFFILLKIILTIGVGILCYFQFKKLDLSTINDFSLSNTLSIVALLILVIPNYWLEYSKWRLILKTAEVPASTPIQVQSFFAGIITGMLTPNMQGNFIGRMYYFERRHRLPIVLLTLVSNLGQFCTTIALGIIALTMSNSNLAQYWFWPFLILSFGIAFYFTFDRFKRFQQVFKWYNKITNILQSQKRLRFKILLLSFFRNVVFSLQFLFALHAFGADFSFANLWLVFEMYLWSTLSPSLFLGKLFIRESIALWIFAGIGLGSWAIVFASLLVWCVNLLAPTVFGLFICKRNQLS